jgi:hypothetical protein
LEYSRLYDLLVFVDQPRIKKIQLKAVPERGDFTLLTIPYLTIPKAFFLAHGKRKFTEQLSSTHSFNIFASPGKKQKLSQRGVTSKAPVVNEVAANADGGFIVADGAIISSTDGGIIGDDGATIGQTSMDVGEISMRI